MVRHVQLTDRNSHSTKHTWIASPDGSTVRSSFKLPCKFSHCLDDNGFQVDLMTDARRGNRTLDTSVGTRRSDKSAPASTSSHTTGNHSNSFNNVIEVHGDQDSSCNTHKHTGHTSRCSYDKQRHQSGLSTPQPAQTAQTLHVETERCMHPRMIDGMCFSIE